MHTTLATPGLPATISDSLRQLMVEKWGKMCAAGFGLDETGPEMAQLAPAFEAASSYLLCHEETEGLSCLFTYSFAADVFVAIKRLFQAGKLRDTLDFGAMVAQRYHEWLALVPVSRVEQGEDVLGDFVAQFEAPTPELTGNTQELLQALGRLGSFQF